MAYAGDVTAVANDGVEKRTSKVVLMVMVVECTNISYKPEICVTTEMMHLPLTSEVETRVSKSSEREEPSEPRN